MRIEMNNKIAIILPVYKKDNKEYLSKSVESVLYQTYKDIHLFIGVDGPIGDNLKDFLEILERQRTISIEWFPENRGLACVLNDLLDICFKDGYEYIARMDADDISMHDRRRERIQEVKLGHDNDTERNSVKTIAKMPNTNSHELTQMNHEYVKA